MRISEIFRLVWLNLSQNKFKVILTSIGIMVGAATIMMVIAIGTGGREEVAEQFRNLNAGAIDIVYGSSAEESETAAFPGMGSGNNGGMTFPGGGGFAGAMTGGGMPGGNFSFGGNNRTGNDQGSSQSRVILTTDDREDLVAFVPGIEDATISYTSEADIEGGEMESATSYTVAGVESNYATLSNLELSIGSFLTDEDNESKEKVCVLGAVAAQEIFETAYDAYGSIVYIDDRPYVVTGVLSEMGSLASGINPDRAVFIPYQTGMKYITGSQITPTLTVIAEEVGEVPQVMENIKTVLADSYPNAAFTLTDAGSKMEAASASNDTLTLLLISMAMIVFIVGGIGIMNVLFVSVKERTNEIGILKALGCARKDILLEFLLEASCISLIGSVIGVMLSLGITPVLESFEIRVSLSVGGGVLSLLFGVLTGSAFGFYPAFKASRLIPVVALNQE
jgi:putative ABC transport system permease protein